MDADVDELLAVRRLLKETTDKAVRLEVELEQARRTIFELELATTVFSRERNERILTVFGCASCHGEHRTIWTQQLAVPLLSSGVETNCSGQVAPRDIKFQRAYVCPDIERVVYVSDESEDTYAIGG